MATIANDPLFYVKGQELGLAPPASSGDLSHEVWSGDRTELIERVTSAMRLLHQQGGGNNRVAVSHFSLIDHLIRECQKKGVALPAVFDDATRVVEKVKRKMVREPTVLCALGWQSSIFEEGQLWVVDWSHALWGDRFYDLASFCVEETLSDDEVAMALTCYVGSNGEGERTRLDWMSMLYYLKLTLETNLKIKSEPEKSYELSQTAMFHYANFWRLAKKYNLLCHCTD